MKYYVKIILFKKLQKYLILILNILFCECEEESIGHLFFQCMYAKIFWTDVQNFIRTKTGKIVKLKEKRVLVHFENGGD